VFWKGVIVASPLILMAVYGVGIRVLSARQRSATAAMPVDPEKPSPQTFEEPTASQGLSIWGPLDGAPSSVKAIVGTLLVIVCAVSFCACVHIFIKAFELGRFSRERVLLPKKK
jgi:hypothetical protein